MSGITSYGAYIPLHRIDRMNIYQAMGWLNPATMTRGEKAVANYDEDSITMAVAAGIDCLNGIDRNEIDGLYFATTTPPYIERQNAGIIATALDLRPDIQTADFAGSTKAGTAALLSAYNAVKAGSAKNLMICISDSRLGKAGGSEEENFGDGAAAFVIGNDGVIANLEGSHSVSYDFADHRRAEGDRYDRVWESRWIRDVGYDKFIGEAISGLLKKSKTDIKDVAKVCYPCLYIRDHAKIGKGLGLEPGQIQDHMFTTVGDTGTAYSSMILTAALEDAKPKDKIIVASYGNGSDAILFEVNEEVEKMKGKKRGIKKHLEVKKDLASYEKYASFREMLPIDIGIRGEEIAFTQVSMAYRERKEVLGLVGSRCKRCGTPQFPPQRVCVKPDCGAIDEMEDYRFSDKKGNIFTYTEDHLAFSFNPPAIYSMVDFDGGGRYMFDVTDCEPGSLKVGMPIEMSFRRKYVDRKRGIHGYFWKAVPVQE
ncbi:MAG: Hydroxymethylglutaryl-CoA synthase [Candidatus Methanolliviera sp. GoM_oil]|nr:MAG: Hydroxymethylglutaryl-CoA synthase [Candidatus Methanolliviera sp. GoM_oil]